MSTAVPKSPSPLRLLISALHVEKEAGTPRLNFELLRQVWKLTALYWFRRHAWRSWLALAFYTAFMLGEAASNAYISKLAGDQLAAMSGNQENSYYRLLWQMVFVQLGFSLLYVGLQLPYMIVKIHWRKWLTDKFVGDYLRNRTFYRIERDRSIDNPDERIGEDIRLFVEFPVTIYVGLMQTVSKLTVFGWVLWSYSPTLVLACFAWAMVGTVVTLFFNKPIMSLTFQSRKLEGDLRFGLVHVRTHAESIALHKGELVEERELGRRTDAVVTNSFRQLCWTNLTTIWYHVYVAMNQLVPAWLMAPMFFGGTVDLSGLTQMRTAWSNVDGAFSFFGNQAWSFATNGAIVGRLFQMRQQCEEPGVPLPSIKFHHGSDALVASRFTLHTPDGRRTLISDLDLRIDAGDSLLIAGTTGVGKSSLVRGLAGLWTRGEGDVWLPARSDMMFLPQRPYTSLGNLREQVSYPLDGGTVSDDRLRDVLATVQLSYLEERFSGFDTELDWEHVLSPGEQQRLAFARVLLRRPNFVILDEATSALDVPSERNLYTLLQSLGCTYVSVGHRPTIFPFHQKVLEIGEQGRWKLGPVSA
jgi:vitamin B12/bleomycin/antimicrobial peptide transport system ATP-binding/permease protein